MPVHGRCNLLVDLAPWPLNLRPRRKVAAQTVRGHEVEPLQRPSAGMTTVRSSSSELLGTWRDITAPLRLPQRTSPAWLTPVMAAGCPPSNCYVSMCLASQQPDTCLTCPPTWLLGSNAADAQRMHSHLPPPASKPCMAHHPPTQPATQPHSLTTSSESGPRNAACSTGSLQ